MHLQGGVTFKKSGIGIVPINPNPVELTDYHKQLLDKIEDVEDKKCRKNMLLETIKHINMYGGFLKDKTRINYSLFDIHKKKLDYNTKSLDIQIKYLENIGNLDTSY